MGEIDSPVLFSCGVSPRSLPLEKDPRIPLIPRTGLDAASRAL